MELKARGEGAGEISEVRWYQEEKCGDLIPE